MGYILFQAYDSLQSLAVLKRLEDTGDHTFELCLATTARKLKLNQRGMRFFSAYKVLVYITVKNEINQKNDIRI